MNIQEVIIAWRYSPNSLVKTTIGFWAKALYELVVMIGVPVFGIVMIVTTIAGFSVGQLPHVPNGIQSNAVASLFLSSVAWALYLRCLLMDGVTTTENAEQNSSKSGQE